MPCTPGFPTNLESKEGWWQVLSTAQLYPLIPTNWFIPPVTLYYELVPRGKTTLRPVTSQGPSPFQVGARAGMWRIKGAVGHLGHPCQLSAGGGDS